MVFEKKGYMKYQSITQNQVMQNKKQRNSALIAVLHIKVTVTPSPQSKIKILTSLQV